MANVITALKTAMSDHPGIEQEIARFCDVSVDTVKRWNDNRMPVGGTLLRLEVFLEEKGYTFESPRSNYPTVRYMVRLFAFRVRTASELLRIMEVDAEDSYFYLVARGEVSPYAVKAGRIDLIELMSQNDAALNAARSTLLSSDPPHRANASQYPPPPPDPTEGTLEAIAAAKLMSSLPFLRKLGIPANNDAAEEVRRLIGDDNFYELLDSLKGMSSREAGKFYRPSTRNH